MGYGPMAQLCGHMGVLRCLAERRGERRGRTVAVQLSTPLHAALTHHALQSGNPSLSGGMAAALCLPRAGAPFILLRASRFAPWAAPVLRRRLLSGPPTAGELPPPALPPISKLADPPVVGTPEPPLPFRSVEAEILRDIDPVVQLIKDILHSERYGDGECLCPKDENVVVEKLLSYHPRAHDKIGCGLDAIMVDRHPEFRKSRCLFVVRTDGVWIDFSYQKCLRAYIREKYPSHAERFIREHFKRT